jgi:hypothetical protein
MEADARLSRLYAFSDWRHGLLCIHAAGRELVQFISVASGELRSQASTFFFTSAFWHQNVESKRTIIYQSASIVSNEILTLIRTIMSFGTYKRGKQAGWLETIP